jgi:hypothetical protein
MLRSTTITQLAPYQCCEAPPSPSSFTTVRVTTDGVYGIVVFTYINSNNDCGDCQFGGILNTCHDNRTPFNIGYVAVRALPLTSPQPSSQLTPAQIAH